MNIPNCKFFQQRIDPSSYSRVINAPMPRSFLAGEGLSTYGKYSIDTACRAMKMSLARCIYSPQVSNRA